MQTCVPHLKGPLYLGLVSEGMQREALGAEERPGAALRRTTWKPSRIGRLYSNSAGDFPSGVGAVAQKEVNKS